ncbi:TRAP transporter small permease [Paenibacillus sp.]|uniref:TRAP transporter small permease n=1 Tax=Paenibacillus sp. TaxID=58172 RepID=UPI002D407B4B|nr:TRAP transporter small permease [Paenibacillus sp.]HZG58296.1 TRAP transporter small permease [Paenibacillus sp.]
MTPLRWLNENIEKVLTATLLLLFSGLMIINVAMLFLIQTALAWASEAVLLMFVFFVWIGISYAFKERKHISVTALVERLPAAGQKVHGIVVNLLIMAFFIMLAKVGLEWLLNPAVQNKSSLLLGYPMWLFYASAPVGAALSIFRLVQNSIQDIRGMLETGAK